MKFVLCQNSNTQRVSVQYDQGTENSGVLLSKDWKKSAKDKEWNIGKGMTIPKDHLINLGRILESHDEQQLDSLLKPYKVLEKEGTAVEN